MAQRLMIARAVLHDPAVLFLDEPTTGLDPQSRHGLHQIVRELRAAGQTIVLITHDMEEADRLADRVAIIDHGRLLALDTPEALKRSTDADTVVTVTADHDSEALVSLLRESLPKARDVRTLNGTVRLSVSGDTAVLPTIARATAEAGVALRDVRIDTPTLETVFFQLTGTDLRET